MDAERISITKIFDDILDAIQQMAISFLVKLGPFFVALMPALFTGYAIYQIFKPIAGLELALFFALVVGFAIETVGIILSHTAIELYNGWRAKKVDGIKVLLMVALVPVYVLSVSGVVLWADEAFAPLVQALGIASPFLTCSVYIAVALARDLASMEQKEQESRKEKLDREAENRAEERLDRRERNEFDLERFRIEQETKAKIEIARAEAEAKVAEQKTKLAEQEAKAERNTERLPETETKVTRNLPDWMTAIPKDRQHFRQLVESGQIQLPENITGGELANIVPGVGSSRTGQNWLSDVRNGKN